MKIRFGGLILWIGLAGLISPSTASALDNSLVVHEWGTFTSIAGASGNIVEWEPYRGPSDLPRFVCGSKINARGTVRMETPVIYFYSHEEVKCSVKVSFPRGTITEIYPPPDRRGWQMNAIHWSEVEVVPKMVAEFPAEKTPSHYYYARDTDSAPLRVWSENIDYCEKFLFYRGVGSFDLPLSIQLQAAEAVVRTHPEIKEVVLLEIRDGRAHYEFITPSSDTAMLNRFLPERELASLKSDIEDWLVTHGLYRREADAMVRTWEHSWFEEGVRLLYVLPRQAVDVILPLSISPSPTNLVRVLVGRLEVITPEAEAETRQLLSELEPSLKAPNSETVNNLRRYGRFSEARIRHVIEKSRSLDSNLGLRSFLKSVGLLN